MNIDIIPNGQPVKTTIGNIPGIVLGSIIRGTINPTIEYHVGYFVNGEHKTMWVYSYEVYHSPDTSSPPGFRPCKPNDKPLLNKPNDKR